MAIDIRRRCSVLIAAGAAVCVLAVTGCGHSSSAEDYKKAAMGSPMTPAMQAAMNAAVKKQQAQAAAAQAIAASTPHGPSSGAVQKK